MIFKSPYPDIAIPEVPLAEFILERAARFSAKPALIDGATGQTLTYGELVAAVDRVAAGLVARWFRKGDVCAIHCLNCPEYAIAFLAVAKVGGVCTMAPSLFNESELTTQLKDSGASYLLTDARLGTTALAAASAAAIALLAFGPAGLLVLAIGVVAALLGGAFAMARVGGVTGDVIGAGCELAQVAGLVACVALQSASWFRPWW